MNEHARHLQPMAPAGVDADATILVLDANARRRIGGPLALVPEAVAHRRNGFLDRDQTFQLLGFDEKCQCVINCVAIRPLRRPGMRAFSPNNPETGCLERPMR
jgi:hypothetical protein